MKSDEDEYFRYCRQMALPEIGPDGQARLQSARVLIVGAGGLGSPAAMSLALAGVGTLGLVDDDRVALSNLHRQPLYETSEVGSWKADAAAARLRRLNDWIQVVAYRERLTAGNALSLIGEYQIVLDCTDNFSARYLINDACAFLRRPDVYGSLYRFDGTVTVFDAGRGPCYRCLYPEPPTTGLVPGCDETGIIGALPAIIGSLQALETMKLILGAGDPLVGRMLSFDGLHGSFREFRFDKNPACHLCGSNPTIRTVEEYPAGCPALPAEESIDAGELKRLLAASATAVLLDVRGIEEHARQNIGGRVIPLSELSSRFSELPPGGEIIVYCQRGERSARAVPMLKERGYNNVKHLRGGIESWMRDFDAEPR